MTEEIKQEALEQLELDIRFGFEDSQQLFDSIKDMFYEEEDFDEDWLQQVVSQKFKQHQSNSLNWKHPTDFEKLANVFDELIGEQKIVCLHNAGYTKSDGEGDCLQTIERLNELGIKAEGFCYYHSQDLGRAVDPEIRNLYLRFDSPTRDDSGALIVANKVVAKLKKYGFEVAWTGTVDQSIDIQSFNWQKVPDGQEWGEERVLQILTRMQNNKKPFWKFW
jgi:hypothetical protein